MVRATNWRGEASIESAIPQTCGWGTACSAQPSTRGRWTEHYVSIGISQVVWLSASACGQSQKREQVVEARPPWTGCLSSDARTMSRPRSSLR